MPLGDVWGNSWGDSWNGHWKQAVAPPVPPEPPSEPARGTAAWLWPGPAPRTRRDVRRDRERFGIPDAAAEVLASIAARQAEQELLRESALDEQQRFDELYRELELKRIEFDARYMEILAAMREELLNEAKRLKENEIFMLLLAVAVSV